MRLNWSRIFLSVGRRAAVSGGARGVSGYKLRLRLLGLALTGSPSLGCSTSAPPSEPSVLSETETSSHSSVHSTEDRGFGSSDPLVCDRIGANLRRQLKASVRSSLVAVSRNRSKKRCPWRVVDNCRVAQKYAFMSAEELLSTGGEHLTKLLKDAPDRERTMGMLVGPNKIGRSSLSGRGCDDATHVVRAYTVGPETKDARCPSGYWKDIDGCRKPMRAIFSPISGAPPPNTKSGRKRPNMLDPTEVSVADYEVCVKEGRCAAPLTAPEGERESARSCTYGVPGKENHPVNCVSWSDAKSYCRFVRKRLPTSSEWNRAAGVGPEKSYLWGNDWPPPHGAGNFADENAKDRFPYWVTLNKYVDGFDETAPVGVYADDESSTGVMNLAGNVREWVADQKGAFRTVRGASFGESSREALTIAREMRYRWDVKSAHIGFRCAKERPVR